MKSLNQILILLFFITFNSCKEEIESEYIKNDVVIGKKDIFIATVKDLECRIVQNSNYDIYSFALPNDTQDTLDLKEYSKFTSSIFPEKGYEKTIEFSSLSPVNISKKYILGSKVRLSGKVFISKERLVNETSSYNAGLPTLITKIDLIN